MHNPQLGSGICDEGDGAFARGSGRRYGTKTGLAEGLSGLQQTRALSTSAGGESGPSPQKLFRSTKCELGATSYTSHY